MSERARQANLSLADSHRSKRNTLLSLGFLEMSNVALIDQPESLEEEEDSVRTNGYTLQIAYRIAICSRENLSYIQSLLYT